jgi:TonB family protein
MVETIVKSSIILSLTFLAAMALRPKSAALRHTVWTAGLLSALILPLLSFMLPVWHLEPIRTVRMAPGMTTTLSVASESVATVVAPAAAVPSKPTRLAPERSLLLIWMIGVLSVAFLLLREAIRLARVACGASAIQQSSWRELVREISHALTLTRRVRLMRNPDVSVLGTWGALRPRVLLPRESETWSNERMRVVLGHELAHVKRNDWLVQIIAEFARAIYWFNPLFWIACTELRRESEHACDDAAMNLGCQFGIDGPTYAGHVLELARMLKHSGQPASAALAMASTSNLERRLVAMLNPSLNRRVTGKGTAVIVVLLALGLTLPLAAVSSQAPVPAVEFAPPKPIAAMAATTEMPLAVKRTLPKAAAVFAPASHAAEGAPPLTAQNQGGTFSGNIMDPTGALVPGVRVNMTAQSTGIVRQTITNESGSFAFAQLPTDNYSGTVELSGFQQGKFIYALSEPGSNARLKFTLQIAPMSAVIYIAAQAPPGLKCFSILGAVKSDGTPFTEADCPGGTGVVGLPAKSPAQSAIEPSSTGGVAVIDSAPATETEPALMANGRPYPIRVGGYLEAGNLMYHPSPAYPSEARNKGVVGVVVLSGIIAKDGQLKSLKVISSSNPLLETSVLETIQSWIYKPTLLNKQPVDVMTTITLNFTLNS